VVCGEPRIPREVEAIELLAAVVQHVGLDLIQEPVRGVVGRMLPGVVDQRHRLGCLARRMVI